MQDNTFSWRRRPTGLAALLSACALGTLSASLALAADPHAALQNPPSHLSPSPFSRRATVEVLAETAAVTYVTSPSITNSLVWWASFLLAVGVLGVTAAVVLPIYHCCRNRAFKKEDAAREAEINKSIQDMTARLYRTRQLQQQQQYGRGVVTPASPVQSVSALGKAEERSPAGRSRRVPPLSEDAVVLAGSPTSGIETAVATSGVRQRIPPGEGSASTHFPDAPPTRSQDDGSGGAAARGHSALTRANLRFLDHSPDGSDRDGRRDGEVYSPSLPGSAASSHQHSALKRPPSSVALHTRSASSRNLAAAAPAAGHLSRAPSVRAFAGMNKVDALRRALGGPQLLPVPSMYVSASRSASPALKRKQSINFVSAADSSVSSPRDSRERERGGGGGLLRSPSPADPSLSAQWVLSPSSGHSDEEGDNSIELGEATPPSVQLPPPIAAGPLAQYTFLQTREPSTVDTDGSASRDTAYNNNSLDAREKDRLVTMNRMALEFQRVLKPMAGGADVPEQRAALTGGGAAAAAAAASSDARPAVPRSPSPVLSFERAGGGEARGPQTTPVDRGPETEDAEEPTGASASTRFLLPPQRASAGGQDSSSGRPKTVPIGKGRERSLYVDAEDAEGESQHVLSKAASAHTAANLRRKPPPKPQLPSVIQVPQSGGDVVDEYSLLMDTQFKEMLDNFH